MKTDSTRRGAALLLVIALVPVLALGAYSFTHLMRAEARASVAGVRRAQAERLADSGIELVRALLADPLSYDPTQLDLNDNAALLAAYDIGALSTGLQGKVTIVARATEEDDGLIRFGISSESAKIPLHNKNLKLTRQSLMGLPGMTEPIADAILDWIDSDTQVNEQGSESSYYMTLEPPYQPTNGPPATIDELLLVKGVTPYLLFGEDSNLDGILNPNENDGAENQPVDNADGILDRGWYPYLTIHSASGAITPAGDTKTNLNGKDQEAVKTRLTELFSADLANFVALYIAEKKSIKTISELIDASVIAPMPQGNPGANGLGGSGGSGGGGGGGRGPGATPPPPLPQQIKSPWTKDNYGDYLDLALEELSVSDAKSFPGLVDISRAPAAVLRCLPDMTEELANQIASAAAGKTTAERSPAWILRDNIVTLEQFRKLEPFITTTGRVFRVEAVGFFEAGGPVSRVEAIIDATSAIPTLAQRRDISRLGSGYNLQQLLGQTTSAAISAGGNY